MNLHATATRDLIGRLITEPASKIEAAGFRCKVVGLTQEGVTLQFSIIDRDEKTLVDLSGLQELKAGETMTIFNFSRFFDVTLSV